MKRLLFKSLLLSLILGVAAYEYVSLPDVALLKRRNPRTTALMELRDEEYRARKLRPVRQQIWVPYEAVSEHLKKAIVVSEDASFFSHKGVDLYELKEAFWKDLETRQLKRGGSTITMQLARNLYLSPSKDPLRKLREVVIALQLERALSKKRIFELYLNVVEWGHGIYGAEAAARYYLAKSAAALTPADAATLAGLLPSPRNPGEKSLLYRRNLILSRMASIGYISADEAEREKRRPLFYKGEESPEHEEPYPAQENSF
ncbi:MAG TPA: monofunctional biosynthetic peptidoglycan transglycosylase [Candidatus Binatia bacterium]